MSQIFLFVWKVADRAKAEGQNSNILTQYPNASEASREVANLTERKILITVVNPEWIYTT